ncbi:MAG: DUF420 domain-containing protein [Candidatus Omnitrophica bacterium]|nr:DUF420 domain-containing protein [Candidatus Omnitrophota bacterium]
MIPLHALPTVNASLNATSACLLLAGYGFIRAKRIGAHTGCMLLACLTSTLFLASYLYYHAQAGVTRFAGEGWIRPAYFLLLLSHTVLAVVIVPLVLRTLWLAFQRRFEAHERWARVTLPLWLYVSVTGVLVYLLLYHMPSAEACPMCSEALFAPGEGAARAGLVKGYAVSVAVLLGIPLLLIGGIAAMVVRAAHPKK